MSNRPSKKNLPSERVKDARNQAQRSRGIWIVAAVVGVVIFALVVAISLSGSDSGPSSTAGESKGSAGTVVPAATIDYGLVEVEGAPLPQLPQSGADTAIGMTAPTVDGQQFDGSAITIGGVNADGKPSVVLGIAHWCPHCQREVPSVQSWIDDNGMPDDVDIVAFSTSAAESQGNWPADEWLIDEGWTVPTMVDDEKGSAAQALGLAGFPYMLVLDADGNVVYRTSGEKSESEWEAIVDAARTGQAPS